jgi:hypothetical protein
MLCRVLVCTDDGAIRIMDSSAELRRSVTLLLHHGTEAAPDVCFALALEAAGNGSLGAISPNHSARPHERVPEIR